MNVRSEHIFHGRVQGVGFRYTTASLAKGYRIVGFVRNRPDGSVELIVEGLESEVAGFLGDVRRTFARNVSNESTHRTTPTGEFTGFDVR